MSQAGLLEMRALFECQCETEFAHVRQDPGFTRFATPNDWSHLNVTSSETSHPFPHEAGCFLTCRRWASAARVARSVSSASCTSAAPFCAAASAASPARRTLSACTTNTQCQ